MRALRYLICSSHFSESLCSENRATGVAYILNPLFYPDGPKDTRTVRGTKLVLVSAGAFGSPGILERSGIGAKDVLERVGVNQRVDLPGVGENYLGLSAQRPFSSFFLMFTCGFTDHNIIRTQYIASEEAQSLAAIFRYEEGAIDGVSAPLMLTRALQLTQCRCSCGRGVWKVQERDLNAQVRKSLTLGYDFLINNIQLSSSIDAGIKWRPTPSEVTELGPDFQEYWESYFTNAPDKPVLWMGINSSCVH